MLNREEIIKDIEKNKIIVIMRGFTEEQLERELKGYFIQDKREDKSEFITNLSNLLKVKK